MIRPYSLLLAGLAFLSLPGRAESKPNWQAEWDHEIRSYWDFLQPKWKGKLLSRDPRISGSQRIGLRMYYHTPELGAEFIRRLYGEMDVTLTREIRQATDWPANGKFAICFFCSEILKVKAQGLAVDEFRTAMWKESRAISAGNMGSIALPTEPPHPNAARVFVNWLLSREGQTALQHADQFRGVAAHRYPQGHGAPRSAARRRRQIYTGGQAGVYGHGADPRHRRESVGAGEDEVKTSWSPAQQPRGHTNTPLHQTLSLVA